MLDLTCCTLLWVLGPTLVPAAQEDPTVALQQAAWRRSQEMARTSWFRGLPWRSVGPQVQGGRLVDIEVHPERPYEFYVAYASGGVWRTRNNGVTFEPLFEHEASMVIGDMAWDPSHPDTLWVGTGENNSSRSSYGGAGVYRSRDGGSTFEHRGLWGSDRIGRIVVDPRDGDRVHVGVLGKLYSPGGLRGVFRTVDGGETWVNVLAGGEHTGCIDLVQDPENPDLLLAAMWERTRSPWNFRESGEGSALHRSMDGGDTWERIEGGFPAGPDVGRIGLAQCASQPQTIYAFVDHQELLPEEDWDLGSSAVNPKRLRHMTREEFLDQDPEEIESFLRSNDLDPALDAERLIEQVKEGVVTVQDLLDACQDANNSLFATDIRGAEVWRSDDRGSSWRRTHAGPLREVVFTYGYYFGQIRVAPDDPDRIYILGVPLLTSSDGGKTFDGRNAPNVHVDHQSLWIDPQHPDRIINGNDGGLNMSFDGGQSWLKLNAVSVGQFYTVAVDMKKPYNIYGGLQDNGTLKGPSTWREGISGAWTEVGGGDGMYVQVDPRDNETIYYGFQFGNYARRGPSGRATVRPRNGLKEESLRYNWCTPVHLSPHNADIVYFGANKLFRSMDQGETWTAISPDLTRSKERGNVPFGTLTVVAESRLRFGLLWVGTDDGRVHVTYDGGATWRDVTLGLPADRWVTRVEPSGEDENVAYVSLSGYRNDDPACYLYRTADLGSSWQYLGEGLPSEAVNVVREDPVNPAVLYVGTDRGAYVSLDRGKRWQSLAGGLPSVPVHDLVVHPRDRELVAATHGRSMWVLDVLPIQELDEALRAAAIHVFPVADEQASRGWNRKPSAWFHREEQDHFLRLPFWCREGGAVTFRVLDSDDRILFEEEFPAEAGMTEHRWNLRVDEDKAVRAEDEAFQKSHEGDEARAPKPAEVPWAEAVRLGRPLYVKPGKYQLEFRIGDASHRTSFRVKEPSARPPRVKKEEPIRGREDKK